ncbi:MAG: hypothetical protein ACXVRJ_11880, partial [Gaiellaceae bacterium]
NLGLSRWPFYEYLAERFGTLFIGEALTDAAGAASAYTGLANAFIAHGTTFSDVYNAWIATDMASAYSASVLQGVRPPAYQTIATGTKVGTVATITVPADHLATRYVALTRGDGTSTAACYVATLSLSVTIPAGALSKPTFFWNAPGNSAVPLSVNGNTATASIPWDTCTWSGPVGLLSLPNASQNLNSANFSVSVSLSSVDMTKPAAASVPPAAVSINTPVIQVPTTDVAPLITVFGSELVKISATDRKLRLIVNSSGQGSLQVSIGSVSLGNAQLRGGNNDVRFTVPQSLAAALRRSAAAKTVLTLTPVSTGGSVTGPGLTRTVSIAPAKTAAKPKLKPKPKPKSGHK